MPDDDILLTPEKNKQLLWEKFLQSRHVLLSPVYINKNRTVEREREKRKYRQEVLEQENILLRRTREQGLKTENELLTKINKALDVGKIESEFTLWEYLDKTKMCPYSQHDPVLQSVCYDANGNPIKYSLREWNWIFSN